MSNISATYDGKGNVVITIKCDAATLAHPTVSNSEATKAAEKGTTPRARQIASTGGFVMVGPLKVSCNAMLP